jgi:hypothetical protein
MKNFTFDIRKMIRWLMPYFLYQPKHYAWLQVLLAPVINQYTAFLAYRQQQLTNSTINSSVNRLTQALWDNFDAKQTAYIVQNQNYQDEAFIFLEADGATPEYDYLESEEHEPAVYDYLESELFSNVNFIVYIPVAIAAQSELVYAFVKKYVFSGISFTVQTF